MADDSEKREENDCDDNRIPVTTTTTRNALITTQVGPCENYPHRVKVSIVGTGKVGMACAVAILMRRMASEVCLVDKDAERAMAEAADIQHGGVFIGNPLVTGTGDITSVKDSAVIIIAIDPKPGQAPEVAHNLGIFRKIIPAIAKHACKAVLVVVTQPVDVMSYITWKLSKFPSSRVLGSGTLVDSMRFQYYLGQKLGLANTSVSCMSIGAQGDTSATSRHHGFALDVAHFTYTATMPVHGVPVWSGVHVAGMKLRDINPQMGEANDPEKWNEVAKAVNDCDANLNRKKGEKGPACWAIGFSTAEIVDAVLRNTKVVLPTSTYIHSCSHGMDKDVYMSIPCVLGKEGVHHTVRQKLTDAEKMAVQRCADNIRNELRTCGILQEPRDDVEE